MTKTSTAMEVGQEGSLREGLEATIRERVREIIEMVLQEEASIQRHSSHYVCLPRNGRNKLGCLALSHRRSRR